MSAERLDSSRILNELRRAFDESFAAVPAAGLGPMEEVLAIRVGGDPFALRLRDIAGVAKASRIVPVPSRRPECLGLAGLEGSAVPVFSLARLLGTGNDDAPGWLALCGPDKSLALAFGELESYRRVSTSEFVAASAPDVRGPATYAVRLEGRLRGIIDMASIIATVQAGAVPAPPGAG